MTFRTGFNKRFKDPSLTLFQEVLKQSPFDAITPASLDMGMRTLSEVMELEKIEHREDMFRTLQQEIKRKDGTTVWAETKFTFIRDKDKQPVGILGVVRDITERKKAEEALRESEEFTIILPTTTSKDGIVTAERIQSELRKEAFSPVSGQELYMTVSIGLAQYKPKEEMKAFVQRIDQLMYQARKRGTIPPK